MKKILACLTVSLFFVMIPMMSSAKKPLTEKEMDSTTAQEGVSINFGGATAASTHFYTEINPPDVQSWGDADGCSTCGNYTSSGWVGVRDMTAGSNPADPLDSTNVLFYNTMTIDVGTSGGVTKTIINPGSLVVHPVRTSATVAMGTDPTLAGTQVLGTIYNSKFALAVNPLSTGYMRIGNHSATGAGEGIEIGFSSTYSLAASTIPLGSTAWNSGPLAALYNSYYGMVVSIPNSRIDISWGDSDGDASGATGYDESGGYFGAKSFYMGAGTEGAQGTGFFAMVSGTMDIDVGSDGTGKAAVVIGLPRITLLRDMYGQQNCFVAPLVFATNKELTDNVQSLGTLYTGGVSMSPSGSLTISSH